VQELTILNRIPMRPQYSAECLALNYIEPKNFRDVCRCQLYFKYIGEPSSTIGGYFMCPDGVEVGGLFIPQ